MEDQYDCFSRQVIIGRDGEVERGSIELPPDFYEYTGIRPGHTVVVQYGGRHLKAKAKSDDLLKRGEARVGPKMAERLGLENGAMICVEDKLTFTERVFDELEDAVDVVEDRVEDARERVFVEGAERMADRRERALDRLIPSRTAAPPPRAIDVEPDLSHIGEGPEEEPVKDISEQVSVWNPDPEGDGVEEFRPGDDDEEEE